MAAKLRFEYKHLQTEAVGEIDTAGRLGVEGVPVHYRKVRLLVRIWTAEPQERLERLVALSARYCPVDSLMRAAVPDYEVSWERLV